MLRDKIIDDDNKRFLIQSNPKPGRFYILPKIHKTGKPGRHIVSSNSHPSERISQFVHVDHHLKPLVHATHSFIKDTTHFLNKLEHLFFFLKKKKKAGASWAATRKRLSCHPRRVISLHQHSA